MSKSDKFRYGIVKLIIKAYFIGALIFSFGTLMGGAEQLGASYPWRGPLIVDGVAMIGLIMRSDAFSRKTRKLGLWIQMVAGTISFFGNILAGLTIGDKILDGAMVIIYLGSEVVYDHIESIEVDKARAKAEADAKEKAEKAIEDARIAAQSTAEAERIAAAEAARIALEIERERIAAAERSERAIRAAATRKERAEAAKAEARRAERRMSREVSRQLREETELAAMTRGFVPSNAPVSSR